MTEDLKPEEVENQESELPVSKETNSDDLANKQKADEKGPIPRKYVSEIVDRERREAFQKGKLKGMEELKAQMEQQQQSPPSSQGMGLGGMANVSQEKIAIMIAEKFHEMQEKLQGDYAKAESERHGEMILNNFKSQMEAARAKYPDFDEKMKDLDFRTIAPIVQLATEQGNAGDIMYDLRHNPQKISHLMIHASIQPNLARAEMQKLATSIKTNQEASKQANAREPLDSITPSSVGGDSGDMSHMSVSDFRKIFR